MTIRITNQLFGTHPVAAHCPGPLHQSWHWFVESVMGQNRRHCDCRDVTVFTWHSGPRPEKPCGVLERSLERLGVPTLVLGKDLPHWKNIRKLAITGEALKRVKTPYVIGADSCDIIFIDDPNHVVRHFQEHFTCDLVFNATGSRCWPELPEFVQFETSLPGAASAHRRYWLNSGLFVGKTEFCQKYFEFLAQQPPERGYEGSDQAVIKRTWPQWYPRVQIDYGCSMFQWFNEDRKVMVLERPAVTRQHELLRLLRQFPGPITGAEVGVFEGHSSEVLLRELPNLRLWMVDPWKSFSGAAEISKLDQTAFDVVRRRALWWTEFASDRRFILPEPSVSAAARFGDGALDFAFIDANHIYECVRADLNAWWPKVRNGGLLTGHDYGVYGDVTGQWGVRRAVNEFAHAHHREVRVGADGVWAIAK